MPRKRRKAVSAAVQQLRKAIEQGKEKDLWQSIDECADVIGLKRGTLSCQLNGYVSDPYIEKTLALVMQKLGEEPRQCSAKELLRQFRQMYEQGEAAGKWQNPHQCLTCCGVPGSTFNKYFRMSERADAEPVPREAKTLQGILARMRQVLDQLPAPVEAEPSQEGVQVPAEQAPPQTSEDPLAKSLRALCDQIAENIMARVNQGQGSSDVPPGIIASPWFDRILAGVAESSDQNLDGVRFILTAQSFRSLEGKVTKEEIKDTILLAEELRRRLNVIAQIRSEDIRCLCFKKLAAELDELFLSYKLIKEVCPTGAAREIERLREAFRAFRGHS
jgi:hypothetical protein